MGNTLRRPPPKNCATVISALFCLLLSFSITCGQPHDRASLLKLSGKVWRRASGWASSLHSSLRVMDFSMIFHDSATLIMSMQTSIQAQIAWALMSKYGLLWWMWCYMWSDVRIRVQEQVALVTLVFYDNGICTHPSLTWREIKATAPKHRVLYVVSISAESCLDTQRVISWCPPSWSCNYLTLYKKNRCLKEGARWTGGKRSTHRSWVCESSSSASLGFFLPFRRLTADALFLCFCPLPTGQTKQGIFAPYLAMHPGLQWHQRACISEAAAVEQVLSFLKQLKDCEFIVASLEDQRLVPRGHQGMEIFCWR